MASHISEISHGIVLNLTEGTFFEFNEKEEFDKILTSLFKKQILGNSRWKRSDKIVFVPENENIKQYAKQNYEKIFP